MNVYAPNIGAPQFAKQIFMDIKMEIERIRVIVMDSKPPLTSVDKSSRQKINKETAALNDTIDDIFRAFHPKAAE